MRLSLLASKYKDCLIEKKIKLQKSIFDACNAALGFCPPHLIASVYFQTRLKQKIPIIKVIHLKFPRFFPHHQSISIFGNLRRTTSMRQKIWTLVVDSNPQLISFERKTCKKMCVQSPRADFIRISWLLLDTKIFQVDTIHICFWL